MATLIDSYSETNKDSQFDLIPDTYDRHSAGQSFTGNGAQIESCKFYLQKTGAPSGNMYGRVYTGSTIPTILVATSDAIAATTASTSFGLVTFSFSGANQITLENGTKYWIVIYHPNGNGSNYISVGMDSSSPSHSGSGAAYWSGWFGTSPDFCFYVYEVESGGARRTMIISKIMPVSLLSMMLLKNEEVSRRDFLRNIGLIIGGGKCR